MKQVSGRPVAGGARGILLATILVFTQTTVGPTVALMAQTTVSERPPEWLVAALVSKKAEVESTVVKPCKTKKENSIAPERERLKERSECRGQLPQLAIIEKQALARYEVLSDEIKDGEIEAEATFTEAAVGQTMDKLLNWAPDKQIGLIKSAEGRLTEVRAPSRVINGELGAFVAEMKAELAGKSKAEARAIIVARLEKVELLVAGVRSLNLAQGQIASHNLDKVMGAKPNVTGEVLDMAYASLVTGLQIAEDQSAKSVAAIVKLNHVLGYAQDTVRISAVFGNLYQLQQNVEGLSSLAAAAESQRKTAKLELDYLVRVRGELVGERDKAQHVAGS